MWDAAIQEIGEAEDAALDNMLANPTQKYDIDDAEGVSFNISADTNFLVTETLRIEHGLRSKSVVLRQAMLLGMTIFYHQYEKNDWLDDMNHRRIQIRKKSKFLEQQFRRMRPFVPLIHSDDTEEEVVSFRPFKQTKEYANYISERLRCKVSDVMRLFLFLGLEKSETVPDEMRMKYSKKISKFVEKTEEIVSLSSSAIELLDDDGDDEG